MSGMTTMEKMKEDFEQFLIQKSQIYFSEKSTLNEAILYSLLAPGKRIRPLLALGFCQGLKGSVKLSMIAGMSVEMIHTYSLIHDDLPAMDNDDFRRGRPTNHKVFGEANAILAGDSLLNFAPEFLMKEFNTDQANPGLTLELTSLLLECSGHQGMIKGQALDMKFESENLANYSKEELDSILRNIHRLKTGAIITWSCLAGLYTHPDINFVRKYKCKVQSVGQRIGLLFQIVDDVLDVTSNLKELGKTPGKDQKAGKLSYTNLHGLEGATHIARNLVQEIHEDLEEMFQIDGDWSIVRSIVEGLEKKLPTTF